MVHHVCRCRFATRRALSFQLPRQFFASSNLCRSFHQGHPRRQQIKITTNKRDEILGLWSKYQDARLSSQSASEDNPEGTYVGFLGKRRNVSKSLSFADLTTPSGDPVQICSSAEHDADLHARFRKIQAHSPVLVVTSRQPPDASREASESSPSKPTLYLQEIRPLNDFPKDIIVTPEVQFPPSKRHLQIRFHPEVQARLRFRSWLKATLNQTLLNKGFVDIETPTLFKSTPEGAREFLVPTRQRGKGYALSQSPQQYKQALMASGIMRYMQWARCYRDEDSRTDRQPEFSQLDMEWSFAGASQVIADVNDMLLNALAKLRPASGYCDIRGERVPVISKDPPDAPRADGTVAHRFNSLTFGDCIAKYGSDKPDLRIPGTISAIVGLDQISKFVSMITHLSNPLIEGFAFSLNDCSPAEARQFVIKFMDSLPPALAENPDGKPQVLIYDSSKPMCGFSSIGFEYEHVLEQITQGRQLNDGDLVVFQARVKPVGQYCASSTKLGDLRNTLWRALVDAELMDTPKLGEPGSLQFLWVTEFPMFKPVEDGEPGQGGAAGITACHHPFTAPLSQDDLELLFTEPLEARSAAYDLVLNGVEIGGGSERNHLPAVQDFIMRDVLRMSDERIADFSHLFEALRAGCPPHAGFALGFDRFVAILSGTSSVRDVIAFPKTMKGEDLFVNSPSQLEDRQLEPYRLQLRSPETK